MEQVFAPKIHGTQILDQLLGEDRAFHILFSSTSTATAPAGQVDYVAANAFLNAFATSHRERGKNITAVNWGIWSQVGMAAEAFGPEGTKAAPETVAYPLFDERYRDERGRQVLTMPLTTEAWLLDEHRTLAGHALVPGTGYIELVHAALRASNEAGAYEVRDLYFIRPLQVDDGSDVEAQVRLNETERGFGIEVRSRVEVDGVEGTQLHAMAQVSLAPFDPPKPIDLEAVRARATRVDRDDSGIRSPQEKHLRFGPRWRVLRAAHYGSDEALGEVELSASFVSDLDDFELHPAMLDYATGFAMELIEGYEAANIWVPVSYDRIRVSGRLPQKVYAWVRSDQNRADTGFATFDVTLADGDGRVLVDIEGFSIKKIEGDVDFAVAGKPSLSDVELTADAQPLSPAELQLKRNLEQGIRPSEGGDALLRLLRPDTPPVVVVSSIALEELVRQADQSLVSPDEGTKFARPNLDSEFVEARNDIERTLVGFWEELLGVDQVGIRDSFFDLGGHSLIAVRLFSKIKKAYQTDFPISVLFEAPTIEACAALIEGEIGTPDAAEKKAEPRRRYTHLVSMHPGEGGEKTPFFLVAGMFGNVLNLRHLA
ncbi:MAG: polyketide synthase dehydratase domain-containing protein, partial [Myxococcota bacterium]